MPYLVETTGQHPLLDMMGGTVQEMKSFRPSVVENTQFVQQRIALGQLTVLAELPEHASDDEFSSYWKESTAREQAIEAYKSKFKPEAEAEPEISKDSGGRPTETGRTGKGRGRPKKSQGSSE